MSGSADDSRTVSLTEEDGFGGLPMSAPSIPRGENAELGVAKQIDTTITVPTRLRRYGNGEPNIMFTAMPRTAHFLSL
jgi:hypothetical protein